MITIAYFKSLGKLPFTISCIWSKVCMTSFTKKSQSALILNYLSKYVMKYRKYIVILCILYLGHYGVWLILLRVYAWNYMIIRIRNRGNIKDYLCCNRKRTIERKCVIYSKRFFLYNSLRCEHRLIRNS